MLKHRQFKRNWNKHRSNTVRRDIANISLGALGIKKYTSSQQKYFAFSWRFIFVSFLFFYLITGVSPWDVLLKSLYALNGQTKIVRLYANNCSLEIKTEDYQSGWWNAEKATQNPDLGPEMDLLGFNDDNSAFYSGGKGSVICSSFTLLTLSDLKEASTSVEINKDVLNTNGIEKKIASSVDETIKTDETEKIERILGFNEEMKASSTYEGNFLPINKLDEEIKIMETATDEIDIMVDDTAEDFSASVEPSKILDSTLNDIKIIEPLVKQETNDIEIIAEEDVLSDEKIIPEINEAELPATELEEIELVEPVVEPAEATETVKPLESAEISWFKKSLNYFDSFVARAEEYITTDIGDLKELGDLKGATINFSLALASLNIDKNNSLEKKLMSIEAEIEIIKATTTIDTVSTSTTESTVDEIVTDADGESTTLIEEPIGQTKEVENVAVVDLEETETEVIVKKTGIEENLTKTQSNEPLEISTSTNEVSLLDKFMAIIRPEAVKADNNDIQNTAKLIIWYATEEKMASTSATTTQVVTLWQKLDVLTSENMSNAMNHGYFSYDAPFLETWDDVNNLKIKIEGVVDNKTTFVAYLDSVWVEAEYDPETDLEKLAKRQRWENALDFLSEQVDFSLGEDGEMKFRYNKNENRIWDTLGEMIGLGNFWEDVVLEAKLLDSNGKILNVPLTMMFSEDGEFIVKLPDDVRSLKPGDYSILFHIEDNSGEEIEIFDLKQDFSWGVLAMNFNKSEYLADETAYLQMAVLDNIGHTICDAEIFISVVDPKGDINKLSTADIYYNPACEPESITDMPDYYAYYNFSEEGEYLFRLKAVTDNGVREIKETIKVVKASEIMVERAGPTRIYPKADYGVSLTINSTKAFKGDIVEFVPLGFKITNNKLRITNSIIADPFGSNFKYYTEELEDEIKVVWQDVELSAGDILEINYTFDAPDESPELYLLGPLVILSPLSETKYSKSENSVKNPENSAISAGSFASTQDDRIIYKEKRNWQVAADAVSKRARTVMFLGGTYSGGGTSGQNSDINQTFLSFNWRLAETGVDIKNAFVIFESQFEAYIDNNVPYSGYEIAFDACDTAPCASAFGTSDGQVLIDDNSVLAYDDNGASADESMEIRLLADVTDESDLVSYTGNGKQMEAQIGYRLEQGAAASSIATAKATLVLTYTYDADSANITNTVVYPLDSAAAGDSGSRRLHQEGDCTFNTDCPQFSYNMELPDFPGVATSTYRLSQWQTYHEVNDNHNATDVQITAQINGESTPSYTYIHEAVKAGTQGNIQNVFFPTLTGFTENSTQSVEYRAITNSTAHDHAIQGGEIFETYIASSSATTKTRTISLPIGVIYDGGTDNSGYSSVDVYFPENGSATGTVKIKSAWFRIVTHDHLSAAESVTVNSKVGTKATSSDFTYEYNVGGSVVNPIFRVFQIIESSNYAELEEANASNPIKVGIDMSNLDVHGGQASAELMITYTYTDEGDGYLTSLQLFAGQSSVNPSISTTTAIANSVMPEAGGKTVRGASILASFLNSDSSGDIPTGGVFLLDANLATGNPSCTATYRAEPDDINSHSEFYKDVTSAMNTTDNQSYNACYADDESLQTTDGAKMNGILIYTYQWENTAPTSSIVSAIQKNDGSNIVDIQIDVFDIDAQDTQARLRFATGTACDFSNPGDPSLDETDSNITADFGDPNIANDNVYQIGTVDAYISTASGTNSVFFDWQAGDDLGNYEGDYCLELTANDTMLDQSPVATTTVYIDTLIPSQPGAMSLDSRTGTSLTLGFGATSTETNFNEYKIFYKIYDGSDPDEGDSVWASTSDINLDNINFNDAGTTTIAGLTEKTTYSIAIWAYDDYGNAASSTRVDVYTNDAPVSSFDSAVQRINGSGIVDLTIKVDDLNNQNTLMAKLEYATGTSCIFSPSGDPTLDENTDNILASFGFPIIDNQQEFQIGSSTGWLMTSPGENSIDFDWLAGSDLPGADDSYCLRLTANDSYDNQLVSTTTTLTLDNVNPSATGDLIIGDVTTDSITLIYASTTPGTDTNEPTTNAYKIFYKQAISGVTTGDIEIDNIDLNAYNYNSATSTTLSGLDQNTWYVFNIWTYDAFGNVATATEVVTKTNAPISNDSLTFTNPQSNGPDTNIAVAGPVLEYTFRAVITEINGWFAISSTTLRIANHNDEISPYNDLVFRWIQSTDSFVEVGSDTSSMASLSGSSSSNCSANTCTLDFNIIFNKTFASSSIDYTAELYSSNDSGIVDHDIYTDFYQVRFPYVEQIHYRWRNDDGGE